MQRPAAHLDPDISLLSRWPEMTHSEFHRVRLADGGASRQCGEVGRPVGDMHALEQALAGELRWRLTQQLLRRLRGKQNAASLVMPRDHVGRVVGELPVTLLTEADGLFRTLMHELHGNCETGGIEHSAHRTKQPEQSWRQNEGWHLRHETCSSGGRKCEKAERCQPRGPGNHAAVR